MAAASGHALLITGGAGIGKTRLVEEVVKAAGQRFRVAAVAASQLESELPFAPLVRALRLRPDASDPHAAAGRAAFLYWLMMRRSGGTA